MTQFSDFDSLLSLIFLRCSRTLRFHTGWSIVITSMLLLDVFVFESCSDQKAEYILSQEKMVEVLTDLQIVEAIKKFRNDEKIMDDYDNYVLFVLKKHSITENQLKESNTYYSNNPSAYKNIMKDVWERLKKIQDEEINRDSIDKNDRPERL